MKQIKFKQLATFGLCCSLLVNSLTGVTAVAETVTIESSPTVESSVKQEKAENSTETKKATTETSQEVTKEQETKESAKQEVLKEKEEPKKVEQDIVVPSINKISPRATVFFPEAIFQIGFIDEQNTLVAPENFSIKYDYINWEQSFPLNKFTSTVITPNVEVPNVDGLKKIVFPVARIAQAPGSSGSGIPVVYRGTAPANFSISIPKYYENLSLYDQSGNISPAYPLPIVKQRRHDGIVDAGASETYVNIKKKTDETYTFNVESGYTTTTLRWPVLMDRLVTPVGMYAYIYTSYILDKPIYYHLTNRKVTENFKDVNGTAIPAPTDFTQGKQTSITNNDYTFTQEGTLPEVYTADGKTYKFKGWYKGKTKSATLETSKTPSYKVTYDDNDDLNVVYEETEAFEFPEETFQFGFVNEAGQLVDPADVNITYDYKSIAYRGDGGTGSTVSFATIATNQSAATAGNLKNVTLPVTSITRPTEVGWNGEAYSNFSIKLPRYYQSPSLYDKTGKINPKYPLPVRTTNYSVTDNQEESAATVISALTLTQRTDQSYTPRVTYSVVDPSVRYPSFLRRIINSADLGSGNAVYTSFSGPVYYHLTNRKVTENFVDDTGAKITPPADFTQGKQTVIDSDNFTYTSAKALPDTYTAGDKAYQFKGWYKGTDKTALKTTKTPSYAVTYDDKDDMTAVYEEIQNPITLPDRMYRVLFINETGGLTSANRYGFSGELVEIADGKVTPIGPVPTNDNSAVKEITVPGRIFDAESPIPLNYGVRNATFTLPKMYKNVTYQPGPNYTGTAFPIPETYRLSLRSGVKADIDTTGWRIGLDPTKDPQKFTMSGIYWSSMPANVMLATLLSATSIGKGIEPTIYTLDENARMYLYLENRRVTENFVDATGAKITPPTGFKQGNKVIIDSDNFTYTSAKALPDTYTAGGKSYQFKGWYKGTDKTALKTTKTPSYAVTYDDKDDMTAVYEEVQATAEMTVNRLLEVVPNEASMIWTVRLKNTSEVPLTNVKLAPTAKWAVGISAPTQLAVRIGNTPNKIIPVTAEQWRTGVNLGVEIPVNGEALVTVNTAKITGEPRQLLTAEMTASGNFSAVTASNFVRIQGEDQTIEPTPAEEGFISTPTFDFGKIMISGSTKQYGLKKAADYYGNGTRNPYLRIKKSQPNWQLTAQLSQLKASTDSLPTSTRLLLGNADVAAIENYNLVTELTNKVGITEPLVLTSDGTSTPVILTNQFTGNDVYQLEFDFASVKLEVPANQGKINEKYQGTVTWNLVTGP